MQAMHAYVWKEGTLLFKICINLSLTYSSTCTICVWVKIQSRIYVYANEVDAVLAFLNERRARVHTHPPLAECFKSRTSKQN